MSIKDGDLIRSSANKILALIPARSGSKRIPDKNVKLLNGKPLISFTIEAANKSKYINRIVVSTDSEAIAAIACRYGAESPFLRPASISQSDSTEMQFLEHTLNWFSANEDYRPDLIVLLYPTSPFRRPETIDNAIEEIIKHPEADSLRSVRLCSEHPYKMWLVKGGYLQRFVSTDVPDSHTLGYQMLPTIFIQNASIYITKSSTIIDKQSPTGDIILPFVMEELESLDINTPLDFKLAELLMRDCSA